MKYAEDEFIAQLQQDGFDYETDVTSMFVFERNSIKTQEDLNNFQDRWGKICKEIHAETIGRCDVVDFLEIRDNQEKQNAATKDPKNKLLNLILPHTLLLMQFTANYYNAPTGCALIQILTKAEIDKNKNGRM